MRLHEHSPVDYDEVERGATLVAATQVEGAVDDWVDEAVRHPEEEYSGL